MGLLPGLSWHFPQEPGISVQLPEKGSQRPTEVRLPCTEPQAWTGTWGPCHRPSALDGDAESPGGVFRLLRFLPGAWWLHFTPFTAFPAGRELCSDPQSQSYACNVAVDPP